MRRTYKAWYGPFAIQVKKAHRRGQFAWVSQPIRDPDNPGTDVLAGTIYYGPTPERVLEDVKAALDSHCARIEQAPQPQWSYPAFRRYAEFQQLVTQAIKEAVEGDDGTYTVYVARLREVGRDSLYLGFSLPISEQNFPAKDNLLRSKSELYGTMGALNRTRHLTNFGLLVLSALCSPDAVEGAEIESHERPLAGKLEIKTHAVVIELGAIQGDVTARPRMLQLAVDRLLAILDDSIEVVYVTVNNEVATSS